MKLDFGKVFGGKLFTGKKARYLRWVGYVAAYAFAFLLFAYVSFPYERLRQYVVATYNASQTGINPNRLEIDSLSWSWRFPGLVAEGVRIVVSPPPVPDGEKPALPQYLEAKEVFVSASPFALLAGAHEASFGAEALGGEVSGFASDSEAGRKLELQLDGVEPGAIPQLAAMVGLPLAGRISGHVSIDIPERSIVKAEGNLELTGDDLVIGDGKAKIQNTIALPPLHLGTFVFKAQITGGRLKIDECTAQGGDVDLTLSGGVRLRQRVESSLADMDLKVSFADKFKTQSDVTKALFGQPDSKVPGLFDTVTSTVLAKQEDGAYAARLTGPIARLKARPAAAGGKRSSSATGTSSATRRRSARSGSSRRIGGRAKAGEEAEAEEAPEEETADDVQ